MVKSKPIVRPYRAGDEQGINNLFNKLFNKERTIDDWNWQFRDNPAVSDVAHWVFVVEKDGVIVGHYATMPVVMKWGKKKINACHGADTMLDSSARAGIKVLRDLFKANASSSAEHSAFGYGYPNELSYKTVKRLFGYKDLGNMVPFYKRLSFRNAVKKRFPAMPSPLVAAAHKLGRTIYTPSLSIGKYTIDEVSGFDSSADRLWDELEAQFHFAVIRDSLYLNWRYRGRGYTIFIVRQGAELLGHIVLKMDRIGDHKVGYIIDILSKKETAALIIKRALRFFIERDADYCLCAMGVGSPMAGYLTEAGFEDDKGFDAIPVVYVNWTPQMEDDLSKGIDLWHITYGDTDGF